MRQRTASSMNFERSPFFMPRAPRYVRRVRSVSLETLMFQRTASLISSMQHLYTQTDKHLCAYRNTGGTTDDGDDDGTFSPAVQRKWRVAILAECTAAS